MIDQDFINQYYDLLILQYHDKPKAVADMQLMARLKSKIFTFYQSLLTSLDLDEAQGAQLDLIGKIIGIPRNVSFVLSKSLFGFDDNPNSMPFADIYDDRVASRPFHDLFTPHYDDFDLSDFDYLKFIKMKIARNSASAYLATNDRTGIQEVIMNAFDGKAYVADNMDMTLTLYIDRQSAELIKYMLSLDLIPKGQGVSYDYVVISDVSGTFGFNDNPNTKGFADLFNPSTKGGTFAELYFMEA